MVFLLSCWIGYIFYREKQNPIEYFKTRRGKGVLKGIVLAIIFALFFALAGSVFAGEFFADGYIYAGLDYTKKASPQCENGGLDDKSTSNLGLVANIYKYRQIKINAKYTHHSCAFNVDTNGYDAAGIELEYRLW